MREYIFRGKRVDNGEWIYGSLSWFADDSPSEITMVERPKGNDKWTMEVISETVGQYVGLCDNNGKKIFEGDIVLWHSIKGTVVWRGHKSYVKSNLFWDFSDDDDIVVIGNIYDNHESLEAK